MSKYLKFKTPATAQAEDQTLTNANLLANSPGLVQAVIDRDATPAIPAPITVMTRRICLSWRGDATIHAIANAMSTILE